MFRNLPSGRGGAGATRPESLGKDRQGNAPAAAEGGKATTARGNGMGHRFTDEHQ